MWPTMTRKRRGQFLFIFIKDVVEKYGVTNNDLNTNLVDENSYKKAQSSMRPFM